MQVRFKFERETKGAVRYHEVDANGKEFKGDEDGALIGALYLRKAKLGGTVPAQIRGAKISVCHGVGGMFAASGTTSCRTRVIDDVLHTT